ncbi:LysR family transcriptional regulator [Sandaracinobacteroides sp. A072]|uniref:LysR family transcriptional regulator n=1 Tax=Sandaracinobacteroides sp. A072 TaxID=3461146 RepID=UPI0040416B55
MSDRLTAIEVFVRASRLGSLSAAARAMGMSPAMAARHLNALEARLGVTLAHRSTRRLSLTEAGADYLDRAERILAELGEVEAEIAARTVAVEGLLRISAPAAFGTRHLAALVAKFARQYPAVTIELGLNDRYVDLLEEGWDMAIRIGHLADSSLIARRLAPVRLSLCAAPSWLATHGLPRTLHDLQTCDCLGYTLSPHTGVSHWSFGRDGRIRVAVRTVLRVNSGELLVQAAIAGQGLVYAPRFLTAEALSDGRLMAITLDQPMMDLGAIHAITHPSRRPAAKTRAWVDFLVREIGAMGADW